MMKPPVPRPAQSYQARVTGPHRQSAHVNPSRTAISNSVQRKSANSAPPVFRPAAVSVPAPPVYRPNTDLSLQQKPASAVRPAHVHGGAPPVYRPNTATSLQQKSAGTAPPVYRPAGASVAAPPVYRPNMGASLQQKPGSAMPPVNRLSPLPNTQGQGSLSPAPNPLQNRNSQRTPSASIAPSVSGTTLVCQPVQMRTATQPRPAPSVVQRKIAGITGLQDLLNEFHEPFRGAITSNSALTHEIIDMLDHGSDFSMRLVWLALFRHGFCEHWTVGICNGTIEGSMNRNWADMHVTGELGTSLDNSVLIERLQYIQGIFAMVEACSGVEGEFELHPTGAVVTKQLITMLAMATNTGDKAHKDAIWTMEKRKIKEGLKKKVGWQTKRNKLAPKIDDDLLPEYFGLLEALQGVQGLRIVPTGMMPFVQKLRLLKEDEQVDELNRSMLDNTSQGIERLKEYEETYVSAIPEMVPSMKVYIKARYIPALLKVLQSV